MLAHCECHACAIFFSSFPSFHWLFHFLTFAPFSLLPKISIHYLLITLLSGHWTIHTHLSHVPRPLQAHTPRTQPPLAIPRTRKSGRIYTRQALPLGTLVQPLHPRGCRVPVSSVTDTRYNWEHQVTGSILGTDSLSNSNVLSTINLWPLFPSNIYLILCLDS